MAELKACPFCGGEPIRDIAPDAAYCDNEECTDVWLEIESWNTRPIEDKQRELMREAAECLRAWTENDNAPQADIDLIKRLEEGAAQ